MSEQFEQNLNSTIIFVLNTANSDRLKDLFARFGMMPYEIDLDSTRYLIDKYGAEFWDEFSILGREVVNDRDKKEEIRRNYNSIMRGDGGEKKEKKEKEKKEKKEKKEQEKKEKTAEEKNAAFERTWSVISGTLNFGLEYLNGINEYKRIGVDEQKTGTEASLEAAKVAAEQKAQSTKTGLIIAGVIVVVAVVAVVLLKVLKK